MHCGKIRTSRETSGTNIFVKKTIFCRSDIVMCWYTLWLSEIVFWWVNIIWPGNGVGADRVQCAPECTRPGWAQLELGSAAALDWSEQVRLAASVDSDLPVLPSPILWNNSRRPFPDSRSHPRQPRRVQLWQYDKFSPLNAKKQLV